MQLERTQLLNRLAEIDRELAAVSVRPALVLSGDELMPKKQRILGIEPKSNDWQSRAIVGYHQAGASSANPVQNAFIDFYVTRGLGSASAVYDNPVNVWGNIRLASNPRQIRIPISGLSAGIVSGFKDIKANDLAQSAEFTTGVGVKLASFRQAPGRVRFLEAVAYFGASGSLREPFSQGVIYLSRGEYLGFVPTERERFHRSYGGGFRISTFDTQQRLAPPATYMVTIGQDQMITAGRYRGPVLRLDVFYPLPVGGREGRFGSLFLFGTINMALVRPTNQTPVAMERICSDPLVKAGCSGFKNFYDPDVRIIPIGSQRDTYRLGFGIDFVNLLRSWISPLG
ncbi:MAG: hypothetical protein FJW36_14085 [Acidobacteria bacterium]|nr:hypothetical protein [Acidobacteriota bacterium]